MQTKITIRSTNKIQSILRVLKFHKNLSRDSFKKLFLKNVVLYEIYSKKMEDDEYLCPRTVYQTLIIGSFLYLPHCYNIHYTI